MSTEMISTLHSAMGLLFLWCVCCFCFRGYLIDAFREELFGLRDELFNYVASIGIPFDDDRHTLLRNFINVTIRFSHKLTFFRLVLVQISKTEYPAMYRDDPIDRWKKALDTLPADQKNSLIIFQLRVMRAAVLQMVWRSPFLIPVLIFYAAGKLIGAAMVAPLKRIAYDQIRLGLLEQQVEDGDPKTNTNARILARV
jgi:hypothetical protein